MADIRLAKPAAGATETVPCEPSARFVFDFPTADATLARDGDDLNITFADGSALKLEDFYQEYTEDTLPSFSVDGTDVAAADFFEAMNEPDLMPAAGPAASPNPAGARFHEWGDSSLTGGIDHLNGLDWGFSRSFEWEDVPNAVGFNNDDDGGFLFAGATPATPVPVPATPGIPASPVIPAPEEPETATYGIKVGLPYSGAGESTKYNIVLAVDISRSMEQYTAKGEFIADKYENLVVKHQFPGKPKAWVELYYKDASGNLQNATVHNIDDLASDTPLFFTNGDEVGKTAGHFQDLVYNSRWNATTRAVDNLLDQYNKYLELNSGEINLSIIAFNKNVLDIVEFNEGEIDKNSIMGKINEIIPTGATNYEAAFQRARNWFLEHEDPSATNQLIFLTDGKPTTFVGDTSGTSTVTNMSDWTKATEIANDLSEHDVAIAIVGIGEELIGPITIYKDGTANEKETVGELTEFGDAKVSNVSSEHGIDAVLQECLPLAVAPDTVVGTEGNDILFGDTLPEHTEASISELGALIASDPGAYADHTLGKLPDQIIGGGGNDILYGQGGADLLIGDGDSNEAPEILHILNEATPCGASKATAETVGAYIKDHASEGLDSFEASLASLERPDDGNDLLFGGEGNDVLLGLGGNDYLNGGAEQDIMFGGSGDDLIVYDSKDYLIDGGADIDFLLADDTELSLGQLLTEGDGKTMPIVNDVEVLLKGADVTSLTSLDQLAEKYGITMGKDGKLTLDDGWRETSQETFPQGGGDGTTVHTWTNDQHPEVTLETTLTAPDSAYDHVLQAAMAETQNQ